MGLHFAVSGIAATVLSGLSFASLFVSGAPLGAIKCSVNGCTRLPLTEQDERLVRMAVYARICHGMRLRAIGICLKIGKSSIVYVSRFLHFSAYVSSFFDF